MLSAAAASVQVCALHHRPLGQRLSLLVYRSPFLVVIPLATITLSASASIDLLALLADFTERHPGIPSDSLFRRRKDLHPSCNSCSARTDFSLF